MSILQFLIFVNLAATCAAGSFTNLHVFVNRHNQFGRTHIITTLKTVGDIWFTTKVSVNRRRLVDYFQTNTSEQREPLLWYRTKNLLTTLEYFNVYSGQSLPYKKCYYHVSEALFFNSGHRTINAILTSNGISSNEVSAVAYTLLAKDHIHCLPFFEIPHCGDVHKPLQHDASDVFVLRATFFRHCPLDKFIQYYWTLHDSAEDHLLEFLGGTVMPELKLPRYRLNLRQQSPLSRMVMIRLNAKIIGRRTPLVARCYVVLASQRLFAAIRGGQYREVFRGKEVSLNAVLSRDLSLPISGPQHLQYEWGCTYTHEQKIDFCKPDMGKSMRIDIPAYSQPNNQNLRFNLLIRSKFDPLRTATTKQTIKFVSSRRLINVDIVCVSNCNGNKYVPAQPIHLKGQCMRCRNKIVTKWKWTVDYKTVAGASRRLIYEARKRTFLIQLHVEAIQINANTDNPYLYRGMTSIHMEKNAGPSDTMCAISPGSGISMHTEFNVTCENSQARFKPLQYCVSINKFLITQCTTDELIFVRLPPTDHVNILICDYFEACQNIELFVDVYPIKIENTESAVISHLSKVRDLLQYADWQKAFLMLHGVLDLIDSKERLLAFTDSMSVYQPITTVQLAHVVRLTKRLVDILEPLDDMEGSILSRMLSIIAKTFKLIVQSNELNTLMHDYYETMVDDLCDLLNKFNEEWEYVPKSQCRAESESCLNIDNFKNQMEQMVTLDPNHLEHVNNWMHAHWKLSSCLFYMGIGTARKLHPEEGAKLIERPTFTMRFESFDLDQEDSILFSSADAMHTIILTKPLLQELRQVLRTDEVLISVRSHKQSPYWWYPEQDSQTQVLVVNAYSKETIWQISHKLNEQIQFISKLKINFTDIENESEDNARRAQRNLYYTRSVRSNDFDDPEQDVENVIHDNVHNSVEVRMYRTELHGHSVLGITFTYADVDFDVLVRMTHVPKLKDMDENGATCRIKRGVTEPITLLLRNRCEKARPVYIYLRATNPVEPWDQFTDTGAYFMFSTEIRSCRIWTYSRPEPSWQTTSCMPDMNKSVLFGIHCYCDYISDFDADAMPIIAIPMNLKCHLERPIVNTNYEMIGFYIFLTLAASIYLFLQMQRLKDWEKRLYVEHLRSGKPNKQGDIIVLFTFGGRYNAGTSANLIFSFLSAQKQVEFIVYQDPSHNTFNRNSTISFRLPRDLVSLPTRLSIGHDNTGRNPHFFCRSVIVHDTIKKITQHFRFYRWFRETPTDRRYKSSKTFNEITELPSAVYSWRERFFIHLEEYMANWYLFQPILGPWRFGISRSSFSRWHRSCIYISKLFASITVVVIYFGRTEPIACDPNPKKYRDADLIVWLCVISYFVSLIVEKLMQLFLRVISRNE